MNAAILRASIFFVAICFGAVPNVVTADQNDGAVNVGGAEEAGIVYKTEPNISYRQRVADKADEYMQERCKFDLYYPANKKNFATVVWFHGGAMRTGEKYVPVKLRGQGIAVMAVNYRMYPKALCPAYIDDAAAAVAWAFENISKYGGDPNLIFVSGHSAGGYLTMIIGLDKKYLAKYGIDANDIAGLVSMSGQAITHSTVRLERKIPEIQPLIDEFAPLFHIRKDAPPLVLVTGDRNLELRGRYEENAYLKRMMNEVGHTKTEIYEIEGQNHGQVVGPGCSILIDHIQRVSKERLYRRSNSAVAHPK